MQKYVQWSSWLCKNLHEEDVQDDAHASNHEHHRDDDIQQQEPICISTHNTWNGNFFCMEVCDENLGDEYQKLAHL